MNKTRVTKLDRERAADTIRDLDHQYLEQNGWKYTRNTPGNYWQWERTLPDGKTLLMRTADALDVQEKFDADRSFRAAVEVHRYNEDSRCVRCGMHWDDLERSNFEAGCER